MKENEMYFNHYKFRSKAEYTARMNSVSARGSWAWTSLALLNDKSEIQDDIWERGHKELDLVFDPTMLVFGPSLEWLLHSGPKHLKEYAKEERVLLQNHLDRSPAAVPGSTLESSSPTLVHFVLPAFASNDGNPRENHETVAAACSLESALAGLNGNQDVWVWTSFIEGTDVVKHVAPIVNEIIQTAAGSREGKQPSAKFTWPRKLFVNTPLQGRTDESQTVGSKLHTRAVKLTIAHKYGGLILDSSVAVHNGNIGGGGVMDFKEFLLRYKDGYGYVDNGSAGANKGFVMLVKQRRHVTVWAELERLAGMKSTPFGSARNSNQLNAFEQWPKNELARVFVKSGQGEKSGVKSGVKNKSKSVLDACGALARDGWNRFCPNTVAWANCEGGVVRSTWSPQEMPI